MEGRQGQSRALGGITSSRCTNEETFLLQKLVRAGFGTNNVDTCARVCHSPTGYGLKTTFGTSAGTQDFDSVMQADVMLVIGANPTDAHPVFASRMKLRLRQMADQIARNFAVQGEEVAIAATAQHIRDFWDPRMKAAIKAADRGKLSAVVAKVVEQLG